PAGGRGRGHPGSAGPLARAGFACRGLAVRPQSSDEGVRGAIVELLERAAFLQTLAEYAGEAQGGSGRLVLVSGESGMGKTVLLEECEQRLPGARWLWGGCDGLLTPRPLGPLFDISAQLGGEFAALCRSGAPRERLFTGFLAEFGPPAGFTVAVIEDVHWA